MQDFAQFVLRTLNTQGSIAHWRLAPSSFLLLLHLRCTEMIFTPFSLWAWKNRLFYYAEYVGSEPFEKAMAKYAEMPGVKDWEELMHCYQEKIPGTEGDTDVWWQQCTPVYHQA